MTASSPSSLLTSIAALGRFKLAKETPRSLDPEPAAVIPCARGGAVCDLPPHIYQHGPGLLAFIGSRPSTRRKLLAIPGVRPHQTGDSEFVVVFPPDAFDAVAGIVRPLKRRPGRAAEAMQSVREAALVQRDSEAA